MITLLLQLLEVLHNTTCTGSESGVDDTATTNRVLSNRTVLEEQDSKSHLSKEKTIPS
jgi:hypothetical protein